MMDGITDIANELLSHDTRLRVSTSLVPSLPFALTPQPTRACPSVSEPAHFCSSCKKRMPHTAFQRRANGSLYNTCIVCLTKTKTRKSQQRGQRSICQDSGREHSAVALEEPDMLRGQGHSEGQESTLGTIDSASNTSTPTTSLFSRTLTAQSDLLENQPINSERASSRSPSPAKRQRTLSIPDSFVQLERHRLDLERRRLDAEQERWRDERAERMRWEQMFREQWQEEREERKVFREREQHIWRLLLAMRTESTSL